MAWRPRGGGELATLAGTSGRVFLWGKASRENWAAFAPGFRELAENEEYVEREDEFDRSPAPESPGPGGVRRPAGAAPDDEGTDREVSLGGGDEGDEGHGGEADAGGGEWGSPTPSGGRTLVRLPPEVWPDEEVDGGRGGGGGGEAEGGEGQAAATAMEVDGGPPARAAEGGAGGTAAGSGGGRPAGSGW